MMFFFLASGDGIKPVCRHELVDMSEQESVHFYWVIHYSKSLPRLRFILIFFMHGNFFSLAKTGCTLYTKVSL